MNTAAPHPLSRRRWITGVAAVTSLAALGRAAAAPRWQIGCYTRPWLEHEPLVALDAIAAAGYRYVGLMNAKGGFVIGPDTPPEKVATIGTEAKARGLAIVSTYGGDFFVPKSPADSIARLRRLIDHCALCGCPSLLLGGTGKAELVDAYYHAVAESCAHAAGKGVGLTIKPHGGTNATGPECRRLIEKVGHPNLRVWYDPGNIYYYSEGQRDPVADAATVDGLVAGMSVKDFTPPKEVNVTPGTGRVDFPKVMARLRQGGFTGGPLVVECLARGDLTATLAAAKQARLFVEALVQ